MFLCKNQCLRKRTCIPSDCLHNTYNQVTQLSSWTGAEPVRFRSHRPACCRIFRSWEQVLLPGRTHGSLSPKYSSASRSQQLTPWARNAVFSGWRSALSLCVCWLLQFSQMQETWLYLLCQQGAVFSFSWAGGWMGQGTQKPISSAQGKRVRSVYYINPWWKLVN